MSDCGIVILAAGESRRLGKPKQLLPIGEMSLLRHCCITALATSFRPVFVVLGANAKALHVEVSDLDICPLVNSDWQKGMGTSIRLGVAAAAKCRSVVLMLCDQPLVSAAAIERLVQEHRHSSKPIAAAQYARTLGTPAVFACGLFEELLGLQDQQGGKAVIQRYPSEVHAVPMPEAEIDIDTEADYQNLLTSFPNSTQ